MVPFMSLVGPNTDSSIPVLHVLPLLSARAGGVQAFVAGAVGHLPMFKIEPTVYTTDLRHIPSRMTASRILPAERPDIPPDVPVHLFRTRQPQRLAFSPDLRRALRRHIHEFAVIHIHSLWLYPQFAAFAESRRANVPYIVSIHGSLDHFLRDRGRARKALTNFLWQRRMLDQAAAIHVTSASELTAVADIATHVPRELIPCGLETTLFARLPDPAPFRRHYLIDGAAPLVLYLGRITRKKRVDILIRALAILHARGEQCHLAVVGPDDEGLQPGLEAVARDLMISHSVHFTGPVYGVDRLRAFAAADIWALPSHAENFGIAAVEALAAGLPVVISRGVDISAEVERRGAGIVADMTAESFADAIQRLLADDSAASSERARTMAALYDWDSVAPRLAAVYGKVAQETAAVSSAALTASDNARRAAT